MNYQEKQKAIENYIDMLQGYIDTIKHHGLTEEYKTEIAFFREIAKGLCVEKYFGSTLKNANRDILQHLIKENLQPYTRMENVESVFSVLYDQKHPIRNNLFYMDCIPVVKDVLSLCGFDLHNVQQGIKAIRKIERVLRHSKK